MRSGLIRSAALSLFVCALARPAHGALESGVYQTLPGATVEESGDRVPGRSRVLAWFATLTFDFGATEPAVTAVITNAVLEGGAPFPLTVRSSFGAQLADGSYRFMGDYLQEINPAGSQYGFDWSFSASTNGQLVWDGIIGWSGGHLWYVTISNITLVARGWLQASPVGSGKLRITWAANVADHVLESASSLAAADWNGVTNSVGTIGGGRSVEVDSGTPRRFFRLRKP